MSLLRPQKGGKATAAQRAARLEQPLPAHDASLASRVSAPVVVPNELWIDKHAPSTSKEVRVLKTILAPLAHLPPRQS